MNDDPRDLSKLSKNERLKHIRDTAKLERERIAKRDSRVRFAWQGGIVLGVVAAITAIVLIVVSSNSGGVAGPANMASNGVLLTSDGNNGVAVVQSPALKAGEKPIVTDQGGYPATANIVLYVDYMCPYCGQFEATNSATIQSMLEAGAATLEVHPIAILDSKSLGTRFSTRAANVAACVASIDPVNFFATHNALFLNQPEENSEGLSNDELKTIVQGAGVTNEAVFDCMSRGTYEKWVAQATKRVVNNPLPNSDVKEFPGTPAVIVNGKMYKGALDDADAFTQFVTTAGRVSAG